MSTMEDWDESALEPSSHMQDVSRAWDSLLEAKNVLQRIENKVDVQKQCRTQAQKVRRRLQLERDSFSGFIDSSHLEGQQIHQRKPDETFTLHSEASVSTKMDTPSDLLSRTRPTPFLQDDIPSMDRFLHYQMGSTYEDMLAKTIQENFNNGQIMTIRGSSEEHMDQVVTSPNLGPQTNILENEIEEIVNPYLDVTIPSPGIYIRPEVRPPETVTPSSSPKLDIYVQKLEHPKRRSPRSKLERLKEKIQEQKRRQELLKSNTPKSSKNPEPLRKPAMKRKVCKVTFGPTALYDKGFSAAGEESVPLYTEEDAIKRERENLKTISCKNEGNIAPKCSKEKSRALKSKSPITRKLSSKSPSPERKVKQSGLYGASAWRDGQKLVQQILGPSPVLLLKQHSPKSDDPHRLQKGIQKNESPDSLKHKQQPKSYKVVKRSRANAQVIPHISTEEHQSRPACRMSGKHRDKSVDRNQSKSPKRTQATDNNMEKRALGKENVGGDHEVQPNSSKRSSYSVEQIRDFMKRKAVERQKMERENQTKMKKAVQIRKEQLDNVLKKQKEAFPPKKVDVSTAVSQKNCQVQPCVSNIDFDLQRVENVRKNLSEWLHVTCDDLLREDDGASGYSKKQKTETLPKVNHSSPLRLKDLTSVPTMSQDLPGKDINSSKEQNDVVLPSQEITDAFSLCRSHQERLQAILSTAMDLGRRVELECNRLGSPNHGQYSPSPCSQMTSASSKYPIVAESEKNIQVNSRNTLKDKDNFLPNSIYTGLSWTPDGAKASAWPLENSRPSMKRDKKGKRGIPHYEDPSSPVTGMEIASKIKAKLQQQEKDLAALRLKAETEAKEAQRCLEEMLRRDKRQVTLSRNRQSPGLKSNSSERQRKPKDSRGQDHGGYRFGAGLESRVELDKPSKDSVTQETGPVTTHSTMTSAPTETEIWDHTEPATDSTSKWSEIGEFYGSPDMFTRFTLEMSQQYLREEELRSRHQTGLLRLREEALKEKTKAELALLDQQKIYWETKNEPSKVEELLRLEQEIQRNLKQEQAEIRHLHNIYKAAHQERKLLLRQQKEILKIQQSAAHIQQKLHNSGVSELVDIDASIQPSSVTTTHDFTLTSERLNQDTQSAISDLSEDDGITEKTQTIQTHQAQRAEDKHTSPVPEVCDNSAHRRTDSPTTEEAEDKADYIPDGAAEAHSLLRDGPQVTASASNPCQTQEDLSDHSTARQWDKAHEEIGSGDKKEVEILANVADKDRISAGEPSLKDENENTELSEVKSSEELRQDPYIMFATQEAANNDHMVTKPSKDHSSPSISAPSKSEILSRASDVVALSPSLAEFQKVSAKLINISESSASASYRGQGGEDTESGDSEVFDMEPSEIPPRGPSDKEWSENVKSQDEEAVKRHIMADGDKPSPKSSSTNPPDSRKPVILVMREEQSKTEKAPLACESFPTSEDLTESDTKTYSINHLPENQDGSLVKIMDIHKTTSMSPKDDGNAAGMSSPDTKDRQRVTETNEKQSVTETAIFRKIEMMPFHATTSKDLFQIKSFPHRSEGDIIFITDEVLQPIEDTLSEILSPVDEKLSYESADLYSPQQDQSEELPSLPRDPGSIKSGDSDTEDFPTPPKEILLSRSESLQSDSDTSLLNEIHLLYDSLLTEDTLHPPDEIMDTENSPLEVENLRRSPEVVKPCRPFLTLSKAEDGVHDPLSTFEIGDRVLVKLSKPGILKYKGLISFKEGWWAGVALDNPDGDNNGTFEGIRYFDCPKNCGVFVRPGQISHLLFDDLDGSVPKKDEDDDSSFGDGPSPGDVQPHQECGGDTSRTQLEGKGEGKKSSENDTRQYQSRSCSLKTLENINDRQDADISLRCLHTLLEEPTLKNKNPGPVLEIKQLCRDDTNKLIVPNPLQDDKHRLLLKVTGEMISRVLCDAIGTYSKISAPEKESVMNYRKEEDEKCMVAEEGVCNQLPSVTAREAGGCVDMLLTDGIDDCIKEYKKMRRKKGKENLPWSSRICSIPSLMVGADRKAFSLHGHWTLVLMNITDGIFEDLVKDSLQVIADITSHREQLPAAGGEALLAR
ncbi:coiled-coil domain-containing protein 187 [Leptodactylus fuscus]